MTTQPEALRLAEILETRRMDDKDDAMLDAEAAAELRRLHGLVEHLQLTVFGFETKLATRGYEIQIDDLKGEVSRLHAANQELLEALDGLVDAHKRNTLYNGAGHWDSARAAIAKHSKEQPC